MNTINKMKLLINQLNFYRDEYYNNSNSVISDKEYDKLYDELVELEKQTGVHMTNSPTQTVGYEVKSKLDKIKHSHPMLSLDKTKSVDDLKHFARDKDCLLSLKMDGLTVLLTYDNGKLIQAETRGNGDEGELITHNAKVFENIPLEIEYSGRFEIEGEAIITYDDFEKINSKLSEDDKYKNPRNLASGSVRQLDSSVAAQRHIKFIAWKIPFGLTTHSYGFEIAKKWGFETVPYTMCNEDNIEEKISELKEIAQQKSFPIDGLVMTYDNIEYGKSLGMTGHHPRHSVAYKFYDDEYETTLRDIEYSIGKTGILTPVAIFDSVEIDGTEVSRASVHNWSMVQDLELGIGDTITVYKANAIIPQIADNLTRSGTATFPDECPICGDLTKIVKDNDTKVIVCTNNDCQGKLLGKLAHAASKNALNIDGLSEATLDYMINDLGVKSIKDLYRVPFYKEVYEKWVKTPGFGKRSVDKLRDAIKQSRNTTLDRFLYAQSINLIGRTASKDIAKFCDGNIDTFCEMMVNNSKKFLTIDGFGEVMYKSLMNWYENHWTEFLALKTEFNFITETKQNYINNNLQGKTFCITGSLIRFANRDALVESITANGGKVVGSVSKNTNYLLTNDKTSGSSKNKKADELGIPVISEDEYLEMIK